MHTNRTHSGILAGMLINRNVSEQCIKCNILALNSYCLSNCVREVLCFAVDDFSVRSQYTCTRTVFKYPSILVTIIILRCSRSGLRVRIYRQKSLGLDCCSVHRDSTTELILYKYSINIKNMLARRFTFTETYIYIYII